MSCLCAANVPGADSEADLVPMPVAFDAVQVLPARDPDYQASYGAADSQWSALWLPGDRDPAPVIVLVHGGCWLADYSAAHIFPLAARLADAGFAVWVPEYRRVGEDGGGWPNTGEDLRRSLLQLAELQEPRLDRQRVLLAGHSAGGHLALWFASSGGEGVPGLRIRGAVGIAAIADLVAYARGSNSCETVTPSLMGGTPEAVPAAYAAASPALLPSPLPTRLLRGSLDGIVSAGQFESMVERPNVAVQELEGAGHFDWIHPGTAAFGELLMTLQQLAGMQAADAL